MAGIPRRTLLEGSTFPIAELAAFAVREGRRPRPIYAAHKWFARRLGTVFRALLVGATTLPNEDLWNAYYGEADLTGTTVLDPFVGGGTSVVEAQRLGASAIGLDIDPIACAVTQLEVGAATMPDLADALTFLQESVGKRLHQYHVTRDDDGNEYVVLHHFWVQVVECGQCQRRFDAHPNFLLGQMNGEQWVFCAHCGAIKHCPTAYESFRCMKCGQRTVINRGLVERGTAACPDCSFREPLIALGRREKRPPTWRLFALEVLTEPENGRAVPFEKRRYLAATPQDVARYRQAALHYRKWLEAHPQLLPDHTIALADQYDTRLHSYGYRQWSDLFNERQLLHLSLLSEAILGLDQRVREVLAMVFSDHLTTNCMQTAYAAGWRRTAPLFSVRAFRHVPRPVEINPWCNGSGRGTFPNTVRKFGRAAAFARNPKEPLVAGGFKPLESRRPAASPAISCGTARDLSFLTTASVDLVLSDPPYFDNIAYSTLSEFFRPWLEVLGIVQPSNRVVQGESLVGQRDTPQSLTTYITGLTDAFAEVARVLKPDGMMVFSFRHSTPGAWLALAQALLPGPLRIVNVLPAPGEAGVGLHIHKGTGLWDAVFVLRHALSARAKEELGVSTHQLRAINQQVETWAGMVTASPLPFSDADRVTLRRASLVGAALRHHQRRRTQQLIPLHQALCKAE